MPELQLSHYVFWTSETLACLVFKTSGKFFLLGATLPLPADLEILVYQSISFLGPLGLVALGLVLLGLVPLQNYVLLAWYSLPWCHLV